MASTSLGCGITCIKYFIGLINLILTVAALCIFGVGLAWLFNGNILSNVHSIVTSYEFVRSAAIALVVVGLFLAVVGFLGCFGTFWENSRILSLYVAIVILMLLTKLSFGIVTVLYRDKFQNTFEAKLIAVVEERYGSPGNVAVTEAWDDLQTSLQCCGARDGPRDWTSTNWYNLTQDTGTSTKVVPDSCCVSNDATPATPIDVRVCNEHVVNGTTANSIYVHDQKCTDALWAWLNGYLVFIIVAAFVLVGIEIFVAVLACILQVEVRNKGVYA